MARGVPTYTTGSLGVAASGAAQLDAFLPIIETALTGYLSNATQAWELYDDIDSALATRNRVYRSVGDRNLASGAGDAAIFGEIIRHTSTAFRVRNYQDWSTSGSGSGGRQSITASAASSTFTTAALTYFIFVNEYEFIVLYNQSTTWALIGWVSPIRTHIAASQRGVAFTTSLATAGSNVVVSIDRDITSSIVVGQKVWAYNLTPAAAALGSQNIQITTVEAVTASTITLDLSENLVSGSIIGADPSPVYTFGTSSVSSTVGNPTLYGVNSPTGEYTGQSGQAATFTPQLNFTTEGEIDPQLGSNLYMGSKAVIETTSVSSYPIMPRGEPGLIAYWGQGSQADPLTDEMYDIGTDTAYKYFGNLLNTLRGFSVRIP
jgi:hypothetical protein